MKAQVTAFHYDLNFKTPGGTSRGVLARKRTYFLYAQNNENWGIGECNLFQGLSFDDRPDFDEKIQSIARWVENHFEVFFEPSTTINSFEELSDLNQYPSIQFGLEQLKKSYLNQDSFCLFDTDFYSDECGIPINGLIWMGQRDFMTSQIEEKIQCGFRCLKMKIGAIDFDTELSILKNIRSKFPVDQLELRVDANGAFDQNTALEKLKRLSDFNIHSIEQPIAARQWYEMAELVTKSPIKIALDEELISLRNSDEMTSCLETIKPDYIILKPGLLGGFQIGDQYIEEAQNLEIGWWITSALESNIGLNAISQWTSSKNTKMPQGLGTGSLYSNNIESPLQIEDSKLFYKKGLTWKLKPLLDHYVY
ncbi:MAG: o-succinylbenzoate synthase [Flavobacteriaceae bacterium]|nr:o-succinylbenzoate synthase [Flavobacteriaceae bacterium]